MPAFWENLAKNCLCDLLVHCNLSNCNYRIFVNETLFRIGFIEISFISLIWLATKPHYSLNFGSEKIGPHAIKLVYTYQATAKRHKGSIVCSTKLK